MEDGARTRRQPKQPGGSKAKSALAQLAELRRTGAKRAETYECPSEDAVYDEMEEDDYARLVVERQREAGRD